MTATLGALVLSSLLAQAATPAPVATASASGSASAMPTTAAPTATPAGNASATPANAGTPDDAYIRRGPGTAPRMLGPHATNSDVTIVNSGSTNASGYAIVLHPDRSADVTVGGTTERKTVGAPQLRWLLLKLRAAGPLGSIASEGCMKSSSFGSATKIAYAGQTTPDLSCLGDATSRELARTANVIVEQLHVPVGRMPGVRVR